MAGLCCGTVICGEMGADSHNPRVEIDVTVNLISFHQPKSSTSCSGWNNQSQFGETGLEETQISPHRSSLRPVV